MGVGSLVAGDLDLTADYHFDRVWIRTLNTWCTIQNRHNRTVDAQTLFESGGAFANGTIYVQDADGVSGVTMVAIGEANIGGGGVNIRDTVTGGPAFLARLSGLSDGERFIVAFTQPAVSDQPVTAEGRHATRGEATVVDALPPPATDQTVTAEGRHDTRGEAAITEEVPPADTGH